MAQGLDAEMVSRHYAKISDEELIRVFTEDAIGITPEAKDIALLEARKRNLHPDLLQGIDAQQKSYTDNEIDVMCALIQTLPCPVCGKQGEALNGTLLTETISAILFTNVRRSILIACPDCLDKAMRKANTKTALLGWWGIPWGIIRTIQALTKNASYRKMHHTHFANPALHDYARVNAGKIMVYRDDGRQLSDMIRRRSN